MVEHFFDVERVRGSSPLPPTDWRIKVDVCGKKSTIS